MKSIFLFLGLSLGICASVGAQRTGIGIRGGYNLASLSVSGNGGIGENRSVSSFNIGGYLDLPLTRFFAIQPGLTLTGKGAKFLVGSKETPNWTEVRMKPIYLELPLNAVVRLPLGGKKNIFAGAGPYIALGVGGQTKIEGELASVGFEEKSSITWGSGSSRSAFRTNLKRYDFGLNFQAGVQSGPFTVNAQYGLGFTDIRPDADNGDDERFKNRVLSLSVGVLF